MALILRPDRGDEIRIDLPKGAMLELMASTSIEVPGMCYGTVQHGCELKCNEDRVILLRSPGVFITKNFIVDQGLLSDGPVVTYVFNLSNHRVRVNKGEVISLLWAV